jgi:hypothetical protein
MPECRCDSPIFILMLDLEVDFKLRIPHPTSLKEASMLFTPLTLPNGATVPNRLAKAAMEETMADAGQLPGTGSSACTGAGPRAARACSSPAT